MKENIKQGIEDIIKQASKGIVKIGDEENGFWTFYTRFYFCIEGKNNAKNLKYPIINVPNYNIFIEQLDDYLKVAKNFYKMDKEYFELDDVSFSQKLFLDLITSATNYNLNNFISYMQLKKEMISKEIPTGVFKLGSYNGINILGNIYKNTSNLESPYKFEIAFDNGAQRFKLPSIYFGIANNTAYVMAVQNDKNKQTNELAKKLDRYFRKVNKDVNMEDIIANVSPNALVSLTLFNSYLKQNGIYKIIAPNFMPVRYHANKIAGYNKNKISIPDELGGIKTHSKLVQYFKEQNREKQHEFIKQHNHNQFNITNKFSYLFLRYCHHFSNCFATYDDATQSVITYLNPEQQFGDNIIFDLDKSVNANCNLNGEKQI